MKTTVKKSNENKAGNSIFISPKSSPFFAAQTKLSIGEPGDKYEQEADHVAEQVVVRTSGKQQFFSANAPTVQSKCVADTITPLIQKSEEEEVQPKLAIQRAEEEEAQPKLIIQKEEEEEAAQPKLEIQRQEEEEEMMQMQPMEEEEEMLQPKREANNTVIQKSTEEMVKSKAGSGSPMDKNVQAEMETGFGANFSKVRLHTDSTSVQMNEDLGAQAFTNGNDIYFNKGKYDPNSDNGKKLLAHELTHTIQQASSSNSKTTNISKAPESIQRRAQYDVTNWSAVKLGPPVPRNGADPRTIAIPPTGQIRVNADVTVNGQPGDHCALHELGTTQTAWGNWIIADYRGATPSDGSMTVSHRAPMPMRDPAPGGSVWYDPSNVRMPAGCRSSVRVSHFDSPWHGIPKARNNSAVAGNPLNYLYRYRRGLHLVTYLTANDQNSNFLRRPLRFVYWNSIQDFRFTPQHATPAAAFGMWPYSGQVTVNIGSKGRGATSDAPYYRTGGVLYNNHFANFGNWRVVRRRR